MGGSGQLVAGLCIRVEIEVRIRVRDSVRITIKVWIVVTSKG